MKGKNTDYEWRKKSPLQGFAKCPTCNHILGCVQSKRKRQDGSIRVHTYFTCRICKCNNVKHKNSRAGSLEAVSYTHLDVYKRQSNKGAKN